MPVAIDLAKRVHLERVDSYMYEDMEYVGKLDKQFAVYRDAVSATARQQWMYVIDVTNDKMVVDCPLTKRKRHGQVCYHPDYTQTDSFYRGLDLAFRLYKFLIKAGTVLCTGDSQSLGSQKLWAKLCKARNVEVWSTRRNKEWQECFVDKLSNRVDTLEWNPYEVQCLTIAHKKY